MDVREGRGGRPVAGRGRAGVALARGSQRGRVSSMGSAGRASAVGMGIWLESKALLCFLFNYDGPGSYKGSFCWGSLEEGGRQGRPVWGWRGSMGRGSTQAPFQFPGKGGVGA